MVHKLWESLRAVLGSEQASWVMPKSFYIGEQADHEELVEMSREFIRQGAKNEHRIFMIKTERDDGSTELKIATADYITRTDPSSGTLRLATVFMPRPYTVKGFKMDLRRYMLVVCVGGHLRGYVHDDGKVLYTRKPYREPWKVGDLLVEELRGDNVTISNRLTEIVSTGYVGESHYVDKPFSALEFVENARLLGQSSVLLQQSIFARLAIALHVSRTDKGFDICDIDPSRLTSDPIPSCLQNSIRFMHFGCDFHVDAELTGRHSRLYGCTKGPDFSVHHYRDGKLKREVAADIVSFMGFTGEFEGSHEARKHRMNLIYDSDTFDYEQAIGFLMSLPESTANLIREEL
jgi:hypothetical protein